MGVVVENANFSIRFSLTCLKIFGLWAPDGLEGWKRVLYNCHTVCVFMLLLGIYIITQLVDLCMIWGNLPLMTATAFLMCTNLVHSVKILNLLVRRERIRRIVEENDEMLKGADTDEELEIVQSCNRGTNIHLFTFFSLSMLTLVGFTVAASLESQDNQLPYRAWYPYDTSKSPAYELTYTHQVTAIIPAACLNVSKDLLVVTLIAQCRCRLRLVSQRLRCLCADLCVENGRLTAMQESLVMNRLSNCVQQHQAALQAVEQLQECFSEPTFAQFTVSLVIICVTAFQLTFLTNNLVRMMSMACYLCTMSEQVFIYCYEGNELAVESEQVCGAVYQFPWYSCSAALRRSALVVMTRCRRAASLSAAGFTTLSLTSFRSIMKASYTFFTVLRQVNERN
ncbi:odorant receptor 2a-like [Zerene cesonia]|uniref:odorant receptor 2a-like n=1 Tax=Zerene cesonia TaxID=33412 RepID=UPI0018E53683|nr:odorant receptor 2a-like [Zerene cesonia]